MGHMSENILLMENREYMYRLLGRIYKEEVDQDLYNQLASLHFASGCQEEILSQGYQEFEAFFKKSYLDVMTDLSVDFARVFLGAGVVDGVSAFPYESVYTSPERLVMQDARDAVVAFYRAYGLDKDENLNIPEDQLGLELEFMGHLCYECKEALKKEDYATAEALLKAQERFLKNHLLNWIPAFCADIHACSESDFYKAVAKITQGYLTLEEEILQYLDTTIMISAHKAEANKTSLAQESCTAF